MKGKNKKGYSTIYSHINTQIKYSGLSSIQVAGMVILLIGVSALKGVVWGAVLLVPCVFIAGKARKYSQKGYDDIFRSWMIKGRSPNHIVDNDSVINKL